MEKISSYLRKLKFDPKLKTSFVASYLANPRLVILIILSIIIFGLFSYLNLPRNLNPEIKIPIVLIQTVLPGTSPEDMESLVTIPIEDSVAGVDNLKTTSSSSRDSVSIVTLEFESGTDPEKAKNDVQSLVDVVNLPEDAQDPRVQRLDFENQPIWTFALTGRDLASLTTLSKDLQEKISDLATVDRVMTTGLEDQEIQVVLKPEAISTYNLNPLILSNTIKAATSNFPAGAVKTEGVNLNLSIDPEIISENDVRNLKINSGGQVITLGQIANISLKSRPDQPKAYLIEPSGSFERVVNFNVFKSTNAKIDQSVEETKLVLDQTLKNYPDFKYRSVINTSEEIDTQFEELTRDFFITVSLVFLVLFIFQGLRQALVSLLSAPLTFFISFIVMRITGISLNFISLFSLLLAMGLLVDDTIVVISAVTSYFRTGKFTPLQAGLLVWRDFLIPVFSTTVTTVWAFLPMLLSTGIIGEFIKPIPIVVSTTLTASFFVAMFLTLPLMLILLKPNIPLRVKVLFQFLLVIGTVALTMVVLPKNNFLVFEVLSVLIFLAILLIIRGELGLSIKNLVTKRFKGSKFSIKQTLSSGLIHFDIISSRYRNLTRRILLSPSARLQTLIMVIIFSVFSYLLFPLGFVKSEFFPEADQDFLFVSLELPPGTTQSRVEQETLVVLERLRNTKGAEFTTASIGQGFEPGMGMAEGGLNNVLFGVKLKEDRDVTSIEIGETLRSSLKDYQAGTLSVTESTGGPPAGADLQISFLGDNLATLDSKADKTVEFLVSQKGVINVNKSIKPGTSKLVFVPDTNKLALNNLSTDNLGFWLRLFASGFKSEDLRLPFDEKSSKDITLRLSSNSQFVENLSTITIPTPSGSLPVTSLGSFKLKASPTVINREDGKRVISVSGGVSPGFNVPDQNKVLEEFAAGLNLPSGYTWKTGGVNEENQESVNSILQAMVLSFVLILITMVIQFSSFRKALIVMLVIPLSISGVFILFALTNTPLSFPALIGTLALFGIVVKNSILVMDKINANLKLGMDFVEAIADGASSRLEPIALTSFATICGLIPITLSDPLWRGLGGAIIAGLAFSGTIMLFFIPTVYYYLFSRQERKLTSNRK